MKYSLKIFKLLKEIRQDIARLEYIKNHMSQEYINDWFVQDAIAMRFTNIGESVNKIRRDDSDFCEENFHISWKSIVDLRNKFVHNYAGIDFKIIWFYMHYHIPALGQEIMLMQFKHFPDLKFEIESFGTGAWKNKGPTNRPPVMPLSEYLFLMRQYVSAPLLVKNFLEENLQHPKIKNYILFYFEKIDENFMIIQNLYPDFLQKRPELHWEYGMGKQSNIDVTALFQYVCNNFPVLQQKLVQIIEEELTQTKTGSSLRP